MKWSLNTYQTAQDWSLKETLRIAKETGYDGVEFLMDFDQPHGFGHVVLADIVRP